MKAPILRVPFVLQKQTIYQKKACQRTCREPLTYYKINSSIQPNICSSNLVHSVVSCCTASFQIHWDSQHNTYFQSSITILLYSTKLSSTFFFSNLFHVNKKSLFHPKVVYMRSRFLQLAPWSRDLSQQRIEWLSCKAEQIKIIFNKQICPGWTKLSFWVKMIDTFLICSGL